MIECNICGEPLDFYTEDIEIDLDGEYSHTECIGEDEEVILDVDTYMETKYQRE